MGNLEAESNLSPINLQEDFEDDLGFGDYSYTIAVNNGTYTNFVKDSAGYGLAQWTISDRKQKLLNYAKSQGTSIGDLNMQLNFLHQELQTNEYKSVYQVLTTTNSIRQASNAVLLNYERPKLQGSSVQNHRVSLAEKYFNAFSNLTEDSSSGVEPPQINIVQKTSYNNTTKMSYRTIKYIVVHYTTTLESDPPAAENVAQYFATTDVEASADFIVDDATIVQYNPDISSYRTWHCGGKRQSAYGGSLHNICTNSNSIGIEICSTSSSSKGQDANHESWSFTEAALNQAVLLIKYLMITYNIPIENVVRHYDVTGKWCPGIIGWNTAPGNNENAWLAFKNRIANFVDFNLENNSKPRYEYVVKVVVPANQILNCYAEPNSTSEIKKTFERDQVLVIIQETVDENGIGWGFTGEGWIMIKYSQKISASEGIINYILAGYDTVRFDSATGQLVYPMESWNELTGGGFKFFSSDQLLNLMLKIRDQEVQDSNSTNGTMMSNNDFIKNIIVGLESGNQDKERSKEKIKLLFKSAAFSGKELLNNSSKNILVKTAADAFTNISEEHILEKLKDEQGQKDIIQYFQETYDKDGWNKNINTAPETLNFWFDFMETDGDMGKYAVKAIGNRPKAINNDKVTGIYFQTTPSVLFLTPEEYQKLIDNKEDFMDMTGYTFVKLQPFMENYFTISGQGKSAKDELDSLLYQHTYATETTTLTAVPIYHLQPNTRVFVKDDNTGINGEYIINKITIPLQYNGTSSITTTKAVERIY